MAKRLFQQSLSDLCVGRSLSFGEVVAYSPRGSLDVYKRQSQFKAEHIFDRISVLTFSSFDNRDIVVVLTPVIADVYKRQSKHKV